MPTIFFAFKISRKWREKRRFLWWDPTIRYIPFHFFVTNQIIESENVIFLFPFLYPLFPLSFPFPIPCLDIV